MPEKSSEEGIEDDGNLNFDDGIENEGLDSQADFFEDENSKK